MAHKEVSKGLRGNFISRLVDQIDMDYENPTSEYNKVCKAIYSLSIQLLYMICYHSTMHFSCLIFFCMLYVFMRIFISEH